MYLQNKNVTNNPKKNNLRIYKGRKNILFFNDIPLIANKKHITI